MTENNHRNEPLSEMNANEPPRQAPTRGRQGLASMDEAKKREIQSKGGKASHGGGRPSTRGRSTSDSEKQ